MRTIIQKEKRKIEQLKKELKKAKRKLKEKRAKLYNLIEFYYLKKSFSIIKIGKMLGFSKVWIFRILEKRGKIKQRAKSPFTLS